MTIRMTVRARFLSCLPEPASDARRLRRGGGALQGSGRSASPPGRAILFLCSDTPSRRGGRCTSADPKHVSIWLPSEFHLTDGGFPARHGADGTCPPEASDGWARGSES